MTSEEYEQFKVLWEKFYDRVEMVMTLKVGKPPIRIDLDSRLEDSLNIQFEAKSSGAYGFEAVYGYESIDPEDFLGNDKDFRIRWKQARDKEKRDAAEAHARHDAEMWAREKANVEAQERQELARLQKKYGKASD